MAKHKPYSDEEDVVAQRVRMSDSRIQRMAGTTRECQFLLERFADG